GEVRIVFCSQIVEEQTRKAVDHLKRGLEAAGKRKGLRVARANEFFGRERSFRYSADLLEDFHDRRRGGVCADSRPDHVGTGGPAIGETRVDAVGVALFLAQVRVDPARKQST